jgi:ferritin
MLDKKMETALSKQLNAELYSSYLYLSMSAYFQSINLPGFTNWMRVQAQEELVHAMKFYDFINERGGRVNLQQIDGPPVEWSSPLDVFENTYKHEQKVTGLINDLVNLAVEARDHATNIFLQWFVTEQVEEEASADEVLQKLKLVGKDSGGLFMLDGEMGQRVFTPPAASTEE